ncbi:hypothetical protein H4219_004065 [Mycoemilia scoparia]|uniref:G patch domain-containing protein n=1 Tax=Mycoemilia scoparia TaxID=417184 RepID=A0A9W7ZYK1_9FUNG|nr:hypothetical protein H4219_004065 [Mycoemilia scoparia]
MSDRNYENEKYRKVKYTDILTGGGIRGQTKYSIKDDDIDQTDSFLTINKTTSPSIPLSKQIVVDEKGRQRLHGAFKGGFSAGYFNTVGSKEGWAPSQFVSSRSNRAQKAKELRPEDFMDAEDFEESRDIQEKVAFEAAMSQQIYENKIKKVMEADNNSDRGDSKVATRSKEDTVTTKKTKKKKKKVRVNANALSFAEGDENPEEDAGGDTLFKSKKKKRLRADDLGDIDNISDAPAFDINTRGEQHGHSDSNFEGLTKHDVLKRYGINGTEEKNKDQQTSNPPPKDFPKVSVQDAKNALQGFIPFEDNPEKQERYKQYLEFCANLTTTLPSAPKPDNNLENSGDGGEDIMNVFEEFYQAARIFRPMADVMANRFTTASTTDPQEESTQDSAEAIVSNTDHIDNDQRMSAAKMNMFGRLTRVVTDWTPVRLLSKRFNLPLLKPNPTTQGEDSNKNNMPIPQFVSASPLMPSPPPPLQQQQTSVQQPSITSTNDTNTNNVTKNPGKVNKSCWDQKPQGNSNTNGAPNKSVDSHEYPSKQGFPQQKSSNNLDHKIDSKPQQNKSKRPKAIDFFEQTVLLENTSKPQPLSSSSLSATAHQGDPKKLKMEPLEPQTKDQDVGTKRPPNNQSEMKLFDAIFDDSSDEDEDKS